MAFTMIDLSPRKAWLPYVGIVSQQWAPGYAAISHCSVHGHCPYTDSVRCGVTFAPAIVHFTVSCGYAASMAS